MVFPPMKSLFATMSTVADQGPLVGSVASLLPMKAAFPYQVIVVVPLLFTIYSILLTGVSVS